MASCSLRIKPSAAGEIEAAPKKDRRHIVSRTLTLADNPRPSGCEKLVGQEKYRVRQGRYRIVYSVSDTDLVVLVVKVGHRKEVYRRV